MQAASYADIDRDVAASFLTYTYEPRIGHSHQFLMSDREGFGKPCSYSLYVPLRSDGFPAMDKILLDTFTCSTINWKCRHHYHNHHYHITTATITHHYHNHQHHHHHNHHNWRKHHFHMFHFKFLKETSQESFVFTLLTFTFWGKSRTKAWFSHLQLSFLRKVSNENFFPYPPLSVPTTQSRKICTLPCLALACCSS